MQQKMMPINNHTINIQSLSDSLFLSDEIVNEEEMVQICLTRLPQWSVR